MRNNNFAVVIPARYQSSRFPGKPLVNICGKPLIQHVWEICIEAVGSQKVYVATDDSRIVSVVEAFGGKCIMTSSDCLTGTDRLAEANKILNCDFLVNVQGDEPVIDPKNISLIVERFLKTGNVTNAMCEIKTEKEFLSPTVPKVITAKSGKLLYMSRAGIPTSKNHKFIKAYKQVCIYAFSKKHLDFFSNCTEKSPMEEIEDIEILRFLENDFVVDMVEVAAGSAAVDVPTDVKIVEDILSQNCTDV